jgi:hypothetical protein
MSTPGYSRVSTQDDDVLRPRVIVEGGLLKSASPSPSGEGVGVRGNSSHAVDRALVSLRARQAESMSPVRQFLWRLGAAVFGRPTATGAARRTPPRGALVPHVSHDASHEWLTAEVAALQRRIAALSREVGRRDEQLEWAHLSLARVSADLAMAERRGEAIHADMAQLRGAITAAEDMLAARTAEAVRLAGQIVAGAEAIRKLDGEAIGLLERLQIERRDFEEEAARRASVEVGLAWSRRQIAELTGDRRHADEAHGERKHGEEGRRTAPGGTKAGLRGLAIAMRMAARAPGALSRTIELIAASPRRLRDLETITASRLFDEKFYLTRNPDVSASGMPAVIHYVLTGAAEGRDPHPLFSTAFYVGQVPGLTARDRNPLHHYLTHGWRAGYAPHPLFDPIHYLAQYEDVAEVDGDPLTHYLEHGAAAGKDPHPSFHVDFYLREHPDVRDAGAEPLTHFVLYGQHEERRPRLAPRAAARPRADRSSSGSARIELVARSLAPPRPDSRPTILVVSHVGPWRPRAGNEYRVQRMLRWYARQGYRVIPVIAPLPGEELPREGIDEIAAEFGHVIQVHRDGRVDYVLRDLPDALATLDGTFTASFADLLGEEAAADVRERELLNLERTFCHDAVIATVLHLQRSLGPHILQVEYIWMTRLLPLVRGQVLKVVDTHDVFSSIAQKVRLFGIRDVIIEPHEEAARLSRADLAIAIQDDEKAELRRLAPSLPIVTAGVDFDVIGETGPGETRIPIAGRILYVASDNARNRKGLEDFVRLAWPRIHQRVPHAELFVAGSVSRAMTGRDVPGVRVLGLVDDLTACYQEAALVINPVVAGTGLKIKMLEALCHLRPIVTWPAGVDGLDPALAELCHVASDWYAFSEQVVRVLTTRAHAGFSAEERAVIARLVSPEHVYAPLDAAFRARVEPSRQAPHAPHALHGPHGPHGRLPAGRATALSMVGANAGD